MSGVGGCCARRILGEYNDPEDTKKNFWVLNNGHQSEDEKGVHEERAVVIIFACCYDHHRANGQRKRGEC